LTRSVAVTPEYSLPAPVRRPNTDERRTCQADPACFGILEKWPDLAQILLRRFFCFYRRDCATIRRYRSNL